MGLLGSLNAPAMKSRRGSTRPRRACASSDVHLLELEIIQTQTEQKPILRAEANDQKRYLKKENNFRNEQRVAVAAEAAPALLQVSILTFDFRR